MTNIIYSLALLSPEIFLSISILILLMLGVFAGDRRAAMMHWLSVAVCGLTCALVAITHTNPVTFFNNLLLRDGFGDLVKILCLAASGVSIILAVDAMRQARNLKFEYPILILFSTLGMMVMVTANDLMSLFIGLELQSLAAYVLASFQRDTYKSTEAGLKYFVLGALSTGFLLYGSSLIYGFSGSTNFDVIAYAIQTQPNLGLVVGLVFVIAALCFKVSAAPFHMWTPDVYEGAPTPVTAFFAAVPKLAALALFVRVLMGPFASFIDQWQQIIILVSVLSMAVGALGAIRQKNLKRLLAYSSIGHVGYALMGLAAGTEEGVRGILVYLMIYMVMTLGTFALLLVLKRKDTPVENIADLSGFSRTHPYLAVLMSIFIFSMAGIPPLAGFFAKLYVFLAAVEAGLIYLAVAGVLTSVIAAYYYLNVIKVMYFDEPALELDHYRPAEVSFILTASGAFTVLFIFFPSGLIAWAATAARVFFSL